jgi:hypothetical protein
VKKITKQGCLHWRAEYGKKYSATVTNGTLSILRRVLDIAVDAGVRYDNPAKAKQVKRVSAKRVEAAGTGTNSLHSSSKFGMREAASANTVPMRLRR